jgi:hypothetical protein
VEKYIHGLFPVWGIRFIAVADSARELGRMLGLGRGTVISHISKVRQGGLKKQKYFRIEIDDEEELE